MSGKMTDTYSIITFENGLFNKKGTAKETERIPGNVLERDRAVTCF